MSEKDSGIYAEEDEMRLHLEGIRRGLENFQSHPRVTPDDAALLMCGINPARKQGITSSDKTAEADYVALLALFQAEQAVNGGHKTLADWLALAEKTRHKHHPVVREYLEFASNLAGYECLTTDAHTATHAPVVADQAALPEPAFATQPSVSNQMPALKRRRDPLTPVIESAVRACDGRTDHAEVFNMLRAWAQEQTPRQPLLGVTDKGIQWVSTNDEPRELDMKALKKRLNPRPQRAGKSH